MEEGMGPLWGNLVRTSREMDPRNKTWITFRVLLSEITPKGFEHNDLLQAILNATEFPDPVMLETEDLERWSKRLSSYSKKGTLVAWLRKHLPQHS